MHSNLLELNNNVLYGISEFRGLLRQFNELAYAQIQGELNTKEAHERRKAELAQETQARIESDGELHDELARETLTREEQTESLQTQTQELSEASLTQSLNLTRETEQRRRDIQETHSLINAESEERAREDAAIRAQTAQGLSDVNEALSEETTSRKHANDALHADIQILQSQDEALQAQAADLAQASLNNALNLGETAERGRDALKQESFSLAENDGVQQIQIDALAEANIQQSLNIHREIVAREEAEAAITEEDTYLQSEIDNLTEATLRGTINLSEEASRRKSAEIEEAQARTVQGELLQAQIDDLTAGALQAAKNLHEALEHTREALHQETATRSEHEDILQCEISDNTQAILQQSLTLAREADKRRELEQAITGLKSPVDWSTSESLAIPEPRCAVVNFTGLKAMPTSKTADIPAFLEFCDMQGNYFKKPIVCSAQGNSSLGDVKKNVKFDLLNDNGSEFDLKIGNWVVQDGFHLKAYYTDFFRCVAVTSYKLWDEIIETRQCKKALVDVDGMNTTATGTGNISDLTLQFDTGALCHPDGFPCIVYLNGEFYGVYSWQIKKQRKNYHLDKSTVEHIHLDGTLYTQYFWSGTINWTQFEIRNPNKLYTMDDKKYDGDAPRELIDETAEKYDPSNKDHVRSAKVKQYIQDFVRRFGELRASPSRERFEELFDWQNQRDYLIFGDVIKNSDGFGKNWQWTTYDGVKWYVNAYDLDMSFGGH